jgi:hypothetical protein
VKPRREREQKLADDAGLFRVWRRWHREQREEALQGSHGAMMERLVFLLKELTLQSAPSLLAYCRSVDWSTVDEETKYAALHEVNVAICTMRERNGLAPISDPLPDERENVSRLIKSCLFPAYAGASSEPMPISKNKHPIYEESK